MLIAVIGCEGITTLRWRDAHLSGMYDDGSVIVLCHPWISRRGECSHAALVHEIFYVLQMFLVGFVFGTYEIVVSFDFEFVSSRSDDPIDSLDGDLTMKTDRHEFLGGDIELLDFLGKEVFVHHGYGNGIGVILVFLGIERVAKSFERVYEVLGEILTNPS